MPVLRTDFFPVAASQLRNLRATGDSAGTADKAFIYVHGFGSNPDRYSHSKTLARVAGDWDAQLFTYRTGYVQRRLPTFTKIADDLSRALKNTDGTPRYRENVFLANSAGGLIVLRALLSDPLLRAHTKAAFLFATPVGGVRVNESQWWKRAMGPLLPLLRNPQAKALLENSGFLEKLHGDFAKSKEWTADPLPHIAMTWGTHDKSVREWSIKHIEPLTIDIIHKDGRTHTLAHGTFHEDVLPARVLDVLGGAVSGDTANGQRVVA